MPKYKYHPPFRISFRYNCHFKVSTAFYEKAVEVACAEHPQSLICVFADAVHGDSSMFVDVSLHAYQLWGKSEEEGMLLFDKEVDAKIHSFVSIGQWHKTSSDPRLMRKMAKSLYRSID